MSDKTPSKQLLRSLPSVTDFLKTPAAGELSEAFGEGVLKFELRVALDEIRQQVLGGEVHAVPDTASLAEVLRDRLVRLARPEGRRVINATGVLLHTGLGRAPMCDEAVEALSQFNRYSVLQASLETGERTLREAAIERMLQALTGCEAATVVNNNAAATMLILNTLCEGKEVIVSRGQLVEIGGAFRMPDVMARSQAVMREIGTTNRTHLRDYAGAINENTGAIIHVHTSNYRIRGFSGTPSVEELCELGRERGIPVIDDIGSGALMPLEPYGVSNEPLIRESMQTGSHVACFSGDKLISGPQAGVIVGKTETVQAIRKNPFARMFRVCKMTLAALEVTLLHYLNGTHTRAIPFWRNLGRTVDDLDAQARALVAAIGEASCLSAEIATDELSYIGSGSAPDEGLPTRVVRIAHRDVTPSRFGLRLRMGVPSVFPRVAEGAVIFDMRTVEPDEVALLADLVRKAAGVPTATGE